MIVAVARNAFGGEVKISKKTSSIGQLTIVGWNIEGIGFRRDITYPNYQAIVDVLKQKGYKIIDSGKTTVKRKK